MRMRGEQVGCAHHNGTQQPRRTPTEAHYKSTATPPGVCARIASQIISRCSTPYSLSAELTECRTRRVLAGV